MQAIALALALAVAIALFGRRAWSLYRLLRSGKPAARFDNVPARARAEAMVVVGQSKLLQRLLPGLMHAAIFWGFLVLFPTIVIAMIGAVDAHSTLPWLGEQGWYALLVDVFAVLVLTMATAIYDNRTFGDLPILADALEDVGCDSEEILRHCRGGEHHRGCWVLDLLLGKE